MTESSRPAAGLLDTSIFIAAETGRALGVSRLPVSVFVSVITVAELHAGVLAAADTQIRARRLATLEAVAELDALVVDTQAAAEWARLRVRLAEVGRRCNVNDLWIASVALANNLPVLTQDGDFAVLAEIGGPAVIQL